MRYLCVLSLLIPMAAGQLLVGQARVAVYPRDTVTFYPLGSAAAPRALLADFPTLPSGQITALAQSGDVLWIGTASGLIRYQQDAPASSMIQYMTGKRYLPDDHVLAIAARGSAGVWVRTQTGISFIDTRPITLPEKARLMEQMEAERHFRDGFVGDAVLAHPGDLSASRVSASDNDGLWTAMYAAAECYRYRVEHSPEALKRAQNAVRAVLFLTQVTGISGYPARAVVERGNPDANGPEWHDSSDGRYRWKGDTSSDEIVGHFFLYSIAYDLLPDGALKQQVSRVAGAIAGNILSHGYYLVGETGKPTLWGKWSMDYFHSQAGIHDGPLNAIELLSVLKTAAHVTGDSRFESAYHKAAIDLGYASLGTRYLELREEINYSDEELFMLSVFPLMHEETNPRLLGLYQQALDEWWRNEQREENPLWTYMYRRCARGQSVQLGAATERLARLPLNRIRWTVTNSSRNDVRLDGGLDRFGCRQTTELLPPEELPIDRWNGNPFCVDSRDDGRSEDEYTSFLLPYWMGRYFGYIQ